MVVVTIQIVSRGRKGAMSINILLYRKVTGCFMVRTGGYNLFGVPCRPFNTYISIHVICKYLFIMLDYDGSCSLLKLPAMKRYGVHDAISVDLVELAEVLHNGRWGAKGSRQWQSHKVLCHGRFAG